MWICPFHMRFATVNAYKHTQSIDLFCNIFISLKQIEMVCASAFALNSLTLLSRTTTFSWCKCITHRCFVIKCDNFIVFVAIYWKVVLRWRVFFSLSRSFHLILADVNVVSLHFVRSAHVASCRNSFHEILNTHTRRK